MSRQCFPEDDPEPLRGQPIDPDRLIKGLWKALNAVRHNIAPGTDPKVLRRVDSVLNVYHEYRKNRR